jgi:hypothetical protein
MGLILENKGKLTCLVILCLIDVMLHIRCRLARDGFFSENAGKAFPEWPLRAAARKDGIRIRDLREKLVPFKLRAAKSVAFQ